MIKIYCLIDPANNEPFYVGATNNTAQRLRQHIRESAKGKELNEVHINILKQKFHWWKCVTIYRIVTSGKMPILKLLFVTEPEFAGLAERFFYNYFIIEGVEFGNLSRYTYLYSVTVINYFILLKYFL